jgi:hypothetical protein
MLLSSLKEFTFIAFISSRNNAKQCTSVKINAVNINASIVFQACALLGGLQSA